jgi:hypothetical protein
MHGPEMFAFFVLCVVLFIGQVFYKEAFSDCNSPGALTWTITMNPGSAATNTCSGDSSSSDGDNSNGSGSGSNGDTEANNNSSSRKKNRYDDEEEEDDNYRRRRSQYYRYARAHDDDNYGYPLPDMDDWWPDVSGSDVSGNSSNPFSFNLSLTDLLSLVGKTIAYGGSQLYDPEQRYRTNRHIYSNSRYSDDDYEEYFDNNKTPASSQGIQYKRGINMDDYVRKDSIPCYACTL